MNKRKISFLLLILLNLNLFFTISVIATDYSIGVKEGNEFIFTIEKYDKKSSGFNVFGINPEDFDENEKSKIEISKIEDMGSNWIISYKLWEYTDQDFKKDPDKERKVSVYSDPKEKASAISGLSDLTEMWIIPKPVKNYLKEFEENNDYSKCEIKISENSLAIIPTNRFKLKIQYDKNGMAEELKYKDGDDIFLEIERERIITGYNFYLIYIIIGCISLSLIVWIRKIKKSLI